MRTQTIRVVENTKGIMNNMQEIKANAHSIEQNKSAIEELRQSYVPYSVFESAIVRYDKIIHRLIMIVAFIVILLVVTNAIWVYAWHTQDFGDKATTMITNDGTSTITGGYE